MSPRAAKQALAPQPAGETIRGLVTPEGVDLRLRIASYGERIAALAIDLGLMLGALILVTIGAAFVWGFGRLPMLNQALAVLWLLGTFLLRNFYFMAFEMRPRAATPGKRVMGLRVVSATGGRLTSDAVFARNAMREIEILLPLSFLGAEGQGVDGALIALGGLWSAVFVLFPLFNRDRRRLGDLAAGTLVVKAPKRLLQADLADTDRTAATGLTFTPAQLDAYGIKELHVLEEVLRANARPALSEVAQRIKAKIAWEGPSDIPDRTFLNAYYAGLRGRLEAGVLLGRRRRDKFDRP
ncbi:RDD family protein [Phenylobacterium sp.]|jgi:uncharacterized RDD family membrane protein YckC|uniref:RDD family protein n=1 Tax=Phenylobacterium sp. TaxID=1871053 RepID=UPI003783E712